jgi:hypothetical protein
MNGSKTRPLEMAVARTDGSWYAGVIIDIPDDTPEEKIEEVAREITLKEEYLRVDGGIATVAHIWVYNSLEDSRPDS